MYHKHFVNQCEHRIHAQCRCPGEKGGRLVRPVACDEKCEWDIGPITLASLGKHLDAVEQRLDKLIGVKDKLRKGTEVHGRLRAIKRFMNDNPPVGRSDDYDEATVLRLHYLTTRTLVEVFGLTEER